MIEIRCHAESDALVVEVIGELTAVTEPMLRSCLDAAAEADMKKLVVDLRSVRRIDRPVAEALLDLDEQLVRQGGSLSLRGLDECATAVACTLSGRGDADLGGVAARGGGLNPSPSPRSQPGAVAS
ncbi:MAG: hypothetical protein V7636_637 [Actinomycetota bacterium]|jgi:anti-anti-sigma factor